MTTEEENAAWHNVCTQKSVIATLVEGQRRQNGSIDRIDRSLVRLLERVPEDLGERLRAVENVVAIQAGATGMAKWLVGVIGFSGGIGIATLLFREGGVLHSFWHAVMGG